MEGVAYLGDGAVEVHEFDRPTADVNEAVIDMRAAGICGSDLHKYHRDRDWAAARDGMIAGHEPCGVVESVGPGVDQVEVGDRVVVYHSTGCGHCRHCFDGMPKHCDDEGAFGRTRDGSHADYMTTPARYCLPLPDELSYAVGTQLACTAGTGYGAVRTADVRPGGRIAVVGLGPVGASAYLWADAMGLDPIGVEIDPNRLALVDELGSGTVIDAGLDDAPAVVEEITDGRGLDAVIECSGSPTGRRDAIAMAGHGATVVAVGMGEETTIPVPFGALLGRDLTIVANSVYTIDQHYEMLDLLATHDVPLDDLVTHRYAIDEAVEAFREFDEGSTGKVLFEWP